jgi:hypothetical protein
VITRDSAQRRLIDHKGSRVPVQGGGHAEGEGGQVLAVAEGEAVQHRDPQRLQVLLQDLLQRFGPGPLGALVSWGVAIAPRLTTSAAINANTVRRRDRWLDARWAPLA